MGTSLGRFAAKLVESSWLAALVVVPIFVNPYADRIFEESKVPLFRSLAVVALCGLIVWIIEEGRSAWAVAGRRIWRLPLVVPTLALAAAYVLSTALSIAPRLSLWGAYTRAHGTYTFLGYETIFFALILLVRQWEQVERVLTTILLTSVPPAVYAIIQHAGADPVVWAGEVTERVPSTIGNPIFLSAFMIMVIPLTLVRMIEQISRLRAPFLSVQLRLRPALLTAAYLLLLGLQLVTVIFTQSRGPFIGLMAGLTVFVVVLAAQHRGRRFALFLIASIAAGISFLVVFNLPDTPLRGLMEVRYIGRLGTIFRGDGGTGKVRTLIWQAATELLAADPLRVIVGYGPETVALAFNRFYPPELAYYESRYAAPDRAHNETFDALITTGVIGLLAEFAVFVSFILWVVHWLGLVRTQTQRATFLGTLAGGGTLGIVIPWLLFGSLQFCGIGLPFGIVTGLAAYLLGVALRNRTNTSATSQRDSLLLAALLAAVVAHLVEINFGIAVVESRLCFWVYAALAVVVGVPLLSDHAAETSESELSPGTLLGLSPIVGLMLVLLTFSFYASVVDVHRKGVLLLSLFLSVWAFGGIIVVGESAPTRWRAQLGAYAASSAGLWLLFFALYQVWLDWQPGLHDGSIEAVRKYGEYTVTTTVLLYGFVLLALLFQSALAFLESKRAPGRTPRYRRALYALLALAGGAFVWRSNLNPARANVFANLGSRYEVRSRLDAAQWAYERAAAVEPFQAHHGTDLARVLMERARTSGDTAQREALLSTALSVTEEAHRIDPLDPDHVRNRAKVHRLWAMLITDPAERARHFAEADASYKQGLELIPTNSDLLNEWAVLCLERGDVAEALAKIEASLHIDPAFAETYWLRGNARLSTGDLDQALRDYDSAIELNPRLLAAWNGRSRALERSGRIEEAIEAGRAAVIIKPGDMTSHYNLAVLYRRAGNFDLAMAEARAALSIAKPAEQPGIETLIEQLNEDRASAGL